MAPSPSHCVKLKARTPSSGRTAKPTKMARAGSAIHATDPCCPARTSRGTERRDTRGAASAVTRGPRDAAALLTGAHDPEQSSAGGCSCADRLVHVVGELLGTDVQLEELADVVQQRRGLRARQSLVPGLREERGLAGRVVDELQPGLVVGVGDTRDQVA